MLGSERFVEADYDEDSKWKKAREKTLLPYQPVIIQENAITIIIIIYFQGLFCLSREVWVSGRVGHFTAVVVMMGATAALNEYKRSKKQAVRPGQARDNHIHGFTTSHVDWQTMRITVSRLTGLLKPFHLCSCLTGMVFIYSPVRLCVFLYSCWRIMILW